MRTTLTLDDDLAGLLEARARELGISFKEMVNRAVRAGLGKEMERPRGEVPKTIPHSFGFKPGIDLDKLNQLADELEPTELCRSGFVGCGEAEAELSTHYKDESTEILKAKHSLR